MTARARKPPAPKAPKLPAPEPAAEKPKPIIRPYPNVIVLAEGVAAGKVKIERIEPVDGQPALVDISWKTRTEESTLRTSRHAANLRGIAA